LLRFAASGFQVKFEPAVGFSPGDEKKWSRLEASPLCDQRAWKKAKRSGLGGVVKNEKGTGGRIPYYSAYLKDACKLTNCRFLKSSQVNTLPKAKSKTRSKQNKDMHKCSSVYGERGVPLPVLTSGGE
jgi:hypothetical protein